MNKGISYTALTTPASRSKHYLLLFLLWPFLTFLLAIKNYSHKESRKVVYIFLIYFGSTFVIANQGVDAFRYALALKQNTLLTFADFLKVISGLYASEGTVDFIEPLVSFIVSRFTSHYSIYFAIWAAIFGYFYLKSINLLYDRYTVMHGINAKIFLVFFIIIIPITSIEGVRMWTAAWIFFYGTYHVVLYRDIRYLILALSSSFVHWSFISANSILLIYFFAGNRNVIYLPLSLASFVVPQLIAPFLHSISLKLGGAMQNRYESYSSMDYVISRQQQMEQASWFLQISNDLVFYYLIFAMIIIKLTSDSLMKEKVEENLFSFLLLFLAFVNFGIDIPSFGSRFQQIFYLFATLYIFLYFIKKTGNKINLITWIGIFPMLLFAAIQFRRCSETISTWILTPGFGIPWLSPGQSIADFLFY